MTSVYPSYAATSTTATDTTHRAPPNGHRKSSDGVARTKILLLGLRRCASSCIIWLWSQFALRSGKTSIQQVLFNKLPPKQTFYLETTMRTLKHTFEYVFLRQISATLNSLANDVPKTDGPGNAPVQSSLLRFGIAQEILLLIHLVLRYRNFLLSFSLSISGWAILLAIV